MKGLDLDKIIAHLQEDSFKKMIEYVAKKYVKNDISKAIQTTLNLNTFKCLMDKKTEFYIKFPEELYYLIDLEMAHKYKEWRFQAF